MSYIKYLKSLSSDALKEAVDSKISDSYHVIIDDSGICDLTAGTNASGWGVDDFETESIDIDEAALTCIVALSWNASGEQEEKPFCGDSMSGTATATIDDLGNVTYDEITGGVNDDVEDEEE